MSENDTEAFLLSVNSSMEADMIESLLKANDIPVLRKYRESGGYMMIMMGSTIYGVDLYVPGDMLDKAREIVENSREASEDAAFPDNVLPEEMTGEDMETTGTEDPEEAGKEEGREDGGEEGDAAESEAEDTDGHEEQYRLAEELTNRKMRNRAWITFLFFALLIFVITMLVKYLYGLFAVK